MEGRGRYYILRWEGIISIPFHTNIKTNKGSTRKINIEIKILYEKSSIFGRNLTGY